LGGIAGLANLHTKEEIFETAYFKTPSTDNPDGVVPQTKYVVDGKYELTLPEFYDDVKAVHQVVDVDYFVGGCPPHHEFVAKAVEAIIKGELPPKGSWITSGKAVCDVCPRNPANKGETREPIKEVRRTIEGVPDEDKCLLQQGYLCFGPITQGDCGASCIKVNIPCRGCGGPLPGVVDYGARAMSAIASLLDDVKLVDEIYKKYPSLVKLFYRYSLPAAIINKKIRRE
jgi:F420-non-reducing hydrogenase small subunit